MRRSQLGLSDGRTLDVVEAGPKNGAPVVLFHGTPTGPLEAVTLESAAEACEVRVICAGRPGYAGSSPSCAGLSTVVSDTRELAALLGLTRWGVLGISGGGPYAAAVAASLPTQVTRLAVLAGSGPLGQDSDGEDDARLIALAAAGQRDAAARGLAAAAAAAVTCPTDLVFGEDDTGCPPATGQWYRSKIPHAALAIIPGADHPAAIHAGVRSVLPVLAAGL